MDTASIVGERPRALTPGHFRALGVLRVPGALLALAGLVTIWGFRVASHDRSIYVSGFGAQGEPGAAFFNGALAAIGLGGICIAAATLSLPRSHGPVRTVAGLLAAGGLCFTLSSRITCSAGCPVPFSAGAELRDLTHVALAVAGFAAAGLAMLLSTRLGSPFMRLVPPSIVLLALPAGAGAIFAILDLSHLPIGGWLELTATTAGLLWLIAFAVILRPSSVGMPTEAVSVRAQS